MIEELERLFALWLKEAQKSYSPKVHWAKRDLVRALKKARAQAHTRQEKSLLAEFETKLAKAEADWQMGKLT